MSAPLKYAADLSFLPPLFPSGVVAGFDGFWRLVLTLGHSWQDADFPYAAFTP